jgi:hypothetical protein
MFGGGYWKSVVARAVPLIRTGKAIATPATNLQDGIGEAIFATPDFTTTSASATRTLTSANSRVQVFTGTATGQSLVLPDATTLGLGWWYDVWNLSSAPIAIKDAGGNTLASLRANGRTIIFLRDISTANGTWVLTFTLDNGNAFGTELTYEEANAETSNNSQTTWANKVTLNIPAASALGDYLVNFQFLWRSQNADRNMNVRVQFDGTDIENWSPFTASVNDRSLIAGFIRVPSISGAHTFTLDFRVGNASGTTVYMQKARMFVWRIS